MNNTPNMNNMNTPHDVADEYDIKTYSDQECFDMLNLNNPSDRELEMKILQYMDNYEQKSKRLYKFFESMYDRFFSEDGKSEDSDSDSDSDSGAIEGFDNLDSVAKQLGNTNAQVSSQVIGNATTTISTVETHNVDYVKDKLKLNPVERKTIFKMISIDSQFRENPANTSATNFTMNLSESIDNVISVKLYSVQIPYTWYTINKYFGSNFFYIKGNSPGINNGHHDVKVEIQSGTYTPQQIADAINSQLTFLKQVRYDPLNKNDPLYSSVIDLSLATTHVTYNLGASNQKVVFEFDLKKKYNETDYQLYFPTWSTPNVTGAAKSLTIPSFFGFNYNYYYPYVAYSQRSILPLIGDTGSASDTLYTINSASDSSNNYFTIYQYSGTPTFDLSLSTIINKIPILFTLPNGTYSRNTLETNIKSQLAANTLLDHTLTRFERVNTTDPSTNFYNHSHYEIAIKLNRAEIFQTDNSKLAIVFPNETSIGGKHIWTGTSSCFVFSDIKIIELNEIVSETETLLTNYIIDPSSAFIKLECTKLYYDVSENTRIATVASSTLSGYPNGYLFSNYIDAINNSLVNMNNQTITVFKPNGEFNINVGSSTYNTGLSIFNDTAKFQFDIAREFTQTTYIVDLSSCFLSLAPFNFDSSINYLTDSSFVLSKPFTTAANILINNTNNKIVLIPKKTGGPNGNGYGNQNAPPIELYFTTRNYSTIEALVNGINTDFLNFRDSDNYPIMIGSNVLFSNSEFLVQFQISKILTESNFNVSFIDSIRDSWNTNLYMDASFVLANNMNITSTHAEVFGRQSVFNNTISLTPLNNKFIFKPYTDGVADPDNANDIIFELPLDGSSRNYTRESLITTIQTLFDGNPLTVGSKISLTSKGNLQFTNIRMNINKTYYAEDFKLVFYDAQSFVFCNVGVTQNATWDSTLGWLLGFQSFTEYELYEFTNITDTTTSSENNYLPNDFDNKAYGYSHSYNPIEKKIAVISNSVLNTNLYNYFLVILDDFIQNHVNTGLITISSLENDIALPSYASRISYQCDPVTGLKTAVSATNKLNTGLTTKELYAMNQIIENKRTKSKSYSSGPYLKDVFALIPMKLTGMTFGQTYMEFGGTMQNQDRKYYGPVRIQKLSVQLMNDKGQIVDLNGANFSICIICEILNKS
jgi:hypothetical protein